MNAVEEKLAKAKSRVVLRAPFFATILLGMDLQIVPDLNPPTMATNGKSIFVHPGFVEACSVEEVCGVLCHETMHVAALHPWRRGTRQPKKANYAMDACFVGDTRVTMWDGELRPIEFVRVGERVRTPFGAATVTANTSRFSSEIVEFDTPYGDKLQCTPDHRILTSEGYVHADNISPQTRCFMDKEHAKYASVPPRNDADKRHRETHGLTSKSGICPTETYRFVRYTDDGQAGKPKLSGRVDRSGGSLLCGAGGRRGHSVMRIEGALSAAVYHGVQYILRSDVVARKLRDVWASCVERARKFVLANHNVRVWDTAFARADTPLCTYPSTSVRRCDGDHSREKCSRGISFPADRDHAQLVGRDKRFEHARLTVSGRSQKVRRVFDLTTEAACFIAEGIVVHNCINPIIEEAGFSLPKGCVNEPQYHGMSFEAIYAKLPDPPPDDGSGQGSGGQGPEQFDDCMDAPGDEAQRQQDEAEAKIRVKQAANAAKAQGRLPSSLEKLVGDVLQPKIDWREELRRYMTTVLKTDQSWNRGQRKFLSQGLYLPALHSPGMGVVVVGIDTSGSVYEQAPEFLSEVQAICEDCSPEKIVVIQCDAKVTAVDEYAAGDPITAKIKGGGGTDLRRIYDKVLEAPSVMVLLTDGQTPWPDAGVDYPHITCTTADECPFGDNIKL